MCCSFQLLGSLSGHAVAMPDGISPLAPFVSSVRCDTPIVTPLRVVERGQASCKNLLGQVIVELQSVQSPDAYTISLKLDKWLPGKLYLTGGLHELKLADATRCYHCSRSRTRRSARMHMHNVTIVRSRRRS